MSKLLLIWVNLHHSLYRREVVKNDLLSLEDAESLKGFGFAA